MHIQGCGLKCEADLKHTYYFVWPIFIFVTFGLFQVFNENIIKCNKDAQYNPGHLLIYSRGKMTCQVMHVWSNHPGLARRTCDRYSIYFIKMFTGSPSILLTPNTVTSP